MMFILCCRNAPNWCGKWWNFGPAGWFSREEHEKTCKGSQFNPDDWIVAGPFPVNDVNITRMIGR